MVFNLNYKILRRYIYLAIIIIAGLSTVLRPSINSNITLIRVLLPIIFIDFFVRKPKKGIEFLSIILILLLYSLFVSYLVSRFHTFSVVFFFYYTTVIFFYYYSEDLIQKVSVHHVYVFLKNLFKILIVLGFFQLYFGGVYINTQDRLPAVNTFFWNENEYSSIFSIFIPLFFLKESNWLKYFWIGSALVLMIHNDAKLALIATFLFFGGFLMTKFKIFKFKYVGLALLALFLIILLYLGRDYDIQGKYTINVFLTGLYEHIMALETFRHIGSFNARSNAIILGIKEFIHSWFLGIGPGNSLLMMKEIVIPGTEHWTALSMHNFVMQVITEIGVLGITLLLAVYFRVQKAVNRNTVFPSNIIILYYASSIISISLLSGPWSNYFFLFIFYFSIFFFESNYSSNCIKK